jgi:hypothetical protein
MVMSDGSCPCRQRRLMPPRKQGHQSDVSPKCNRTRTEKSLLTYPLKLMDNKLILLLAMEVLRVVNPLFNIQTVCEMRHGQG